MEYILAVTGTLLVIIQFHRNTLLKKQLDKQPTSTTICVPAPIVNVTVDPKAPMVTVLAEPSDVKFELDYDRLSIAIRKALLESHVAVHNADTIPVQLIDDTDLITNTVVTPSLEIDGIPVRQFPSR